MTRHCLNLVSRAAILTLACGLISSCDVFTGSDCHSVAGYALRVVVTDSVTGQPAASVPSLTVTDGDFTEVHPEPDNGPQEFLAARERPGVYQVVVRAAGYADWTRSGIRVDRSGDCKLIQTATVNARLQRP